MIPDSFAKAFLGCRQRSHLLLIAVALGFPAASVAQADSSLIQTGNSGAAKYSVQTVSETNLTVTLVSGLLSIEHDMMLGNLFLRSGMENPDGSHFNDPRKDRYPLIKADLMAAGVPDLEPLLIALEDAKDEAAVNDAYLAMVSALKIATQTLKPTERDILAAVILTTEEAAGMIDASGTTDVKLYQECWGLMMVARSTLDTLMKAEDPAVKKSAEGMAAAYDDAIIALPDPVVSAPVAFDPAILHALIAVLNGDISET